MKTYKDFQSIKEMTDILQSMSVNELKNLSSITINIDELSIEQKILLTGLDKWKIIRIETQKENATLKEILTYCEKLQIPYQSFIPELFSERLTMR